MKKKNIWIIWVIGFVLLFVAASAVYNQLGDKFGSDLLLQDKEEESTDNRRKAPDFVVFDEEGNEVKLSGFQGKPVVLNFWSSWCGPCKREMPDFQKVYEEYGDDIHFVMVNATDGKREKQDTAMEFIDKEGYTFPVYYDLLLKASNAYAVYSIPRTYFIDAEGNLIDSVHGGMNEKMLIEKLEQIL